MSVVVIATVVPQPEHRAEVITALERSIARVHAEDPGCELYALHEDENRLVVVEKWADRAALEAHSRGAAANQVAIDLAGTLIGGLELMVLTPHPIGTAQLGTL